MYKIYMKLMMVLYLIIGNIIFGELTAEEKNIISTEANEAIKSGEIIKAAKIFKAIVDADNEDLEAKNILSKIYKISGDVDGEKNLYIELINEGDKSPRSKLAEIYYSEQKYKEALELYQEIYEEEPLPEIMYNIGVIYENLRDYEKAEEWYIKAAKKKHMGAYYNLGLLYSSEKKYKEAAKWYEKPAKKGDPKAQNNLGYTYYRLKNNRKAVLWLERALIEAQKNEDVDVIKEAQEALKEINGE